MLKGSVLFRSPPVRVRALLRHGNTQGPSVYLGDDPGTCTSCYPETGLKDSHRIWSVEVICTPFLLSPHIALATTSLQASSVSSRDVGCRLVRRPLAPDLSTDRGLATRRRRGTRRDSTVEGFGSGAPQKENPIRTVP